MMRWSPPSILPGLLGLSFLLLEFKTPVEAQTDYGNRLGDRVGDRIVYQTSGVPIYTGTLDPTIQRWYLPPVLFEEYGRRQWEYTNYARDRSKRYVEASLAGDYFYDVYGGLITQGWLLYDWRQTQPLIFESSQVFKSSRYIRDFSRLIISTDRKGAYSYSIMVGDEIATTLTPMTFRKAGFNGLVTSFATDHYRLTGLFSRISLPVLGASASRVQNFTNLTGGRVEADITDFFTLGTTFVNSHNITGSREGFKDNPFKGLVTSGQSSQRLNLLVVRLSDDSPEDDEGGAILISEALEIQTMLMREVRVGDSLVIVSRDTVIVTSSIDFHPTIEGGKQKEGFLTADGPESIVLKYVLAPAGSTGEEGSLRLRLQQHLGLSLAEAEDAITAIKDVRFRLVVANDYRVEMSSDRQTDPFGVPQFLVVARAPGNIKNQLNQREVVFDYGLPTANQIYGFSGEVRDFFGFDFYGEANINTQFRKYPSITRKTHRAISGITGDKHAVGWMVNLSWKAGPWSFLGEGFGMDDGYTTSVLPVDRNGVADYSPEATNLLYDFVDDNDDNDRHPDQLRVGEGSLVPRRETPGIEIRGVADPAVFPGYDENSDFISDFNQNSTPERENFFPDYEEPFLRYRVDRPEFLFGIDLNNNGWIERFENDDLPDYPYKKDLWGYNVYGMVQISPELRMTLGQLRQDMRKASRKNHTTYALFTLERDWPTWGRVRVFDMFKKAEDTMADDLVQWLIPRSKFGNPVETAGRNERVLDPLAAEDTWINAFYVDWEYASPRRWRTLHRCKWETWRQRQTEVEFLQDAEGNPVLDAEGVPIVVFDPLGPEARNGRRDSGFLGVIDKIEYPYRWKSLEIVPRVKSEFLREVPFSLDMEKQHSWDSIFFFQVQISVLKSTQVRAGWEQRFFYNLIGEEDELKPRDFTGDFRGSVLALQLSNRSSYQSYSLITQVGFRVDRRSLEVIDRPRESETSGLLFLSMFAGLR